jgi:hypothetical protein
MVLRFLTIGAEHFKGGGSILLRTADWLNSDRFVPPSAVNNTTRDALLRAGLVTEATLRSHQIY